MEVKTGLTVALSEEDAETLRNQFKILATSAIDEVRQQAALSSDWLKGKKAARSYLGGLSEANFNRLKLPSRLIDGVYFYNKKEIDEFIFKNY